MVLVSAKQRKLMVQVASANRTRKRAHDREMWAKASPGACESCGASSCGHLWPETRCCIACTHVPVEGWRQTHSAYERAHKFPVMEVAMRAGDRIFFRADGAVQFVQLASGSDERPRVLFEGDDLSTGALFVVGREEYDEENQWFNRKAGGLEGRLSGDDSELEEPEEETVDMDEFDFEEDAEEETEEDAEAEDEEPGEDQEELEEYEDPDGFEADGTAIDDSEPEDTEEAP